MKIKLLCCSILAMLFASTVMAAPEFYGQAKACKIEVLDHSFPVQFGVGDFSVTMKIKNAGDAALRGAFVVESTDAKGGGMRLHASCGIDLPPPSVSDVEIELKADGKFAADEVKRIVKIFLKTSAGDVLCYEGTVAEKAIAAAKRAAEKKEAGPVFARNYEIKFVDSLLEGEGAKWRKFIENGGALIVSNISSDRDFAGAAEFCDKQYLPSYYQQRMPLSFRDRPVVAGGMPYLDWPNRISETLVAGSGRFRLSGNSQLKGAYTFWKQVQNGYTVMMRIGNGLLMLSTLKLADTPALRENIITNLKFNEAKYRFGYFFYDFNSEDGFKGKSNFPTTAGGQVSLRVYNTDTEPSRKINIACRFTLTALDGSGKSRTFVSRRRQSSKPEDWLDLRIGIPVLPADFTGQWLAKIEFYEWDEEKVWVIDERKVVFPEIIEIVPPDYRSAVSTKRRDAAVAIGIKANRVNLDMGGMKWKLVAKDAKTGKVVAKSEGLFEKGERFAEAKLPIARNAPAGKYLLEAEVETPCAGVKNAKGEFFIVAPEKGQLLVDQDGFFLNEGEPYFPLGAYHITAKQWNEPIDESGLKAADMGFNWRQMWGDEWLRSYSLDRADVAKAVNEKLTGEEREKAIDALLITNKANRAALKDVVVCMEAFNLWDSVYFEKPGETGKYYYELDPAIAAQVKKIAEDDAQLVRMWHIANRCSDERYCQLLRTANWIRKYDTKYHPVLNLGNLSAKMAGDIGGDSFSMRYRGEVGEARVFAENVAKLSEELSRFHRRPFVVPQSYGAKGQSSETPEWVRAQAYLAIINGANGLGFYCWKLTGSQAHNAQGMGWHPPTAKMVKQVIAEVKEFALALRVPGQKKLVSNDGNVLALLCGDKASGRYLIAANMLELPIDTELPVPGIADLELEPLFGAPAAERPGGFLGFGKREALTFSLPALGTAVWRVK